MLDPDDMVVQITTICFAPVVAGISLITSMIYPLIDPQVHHE
jgi:ABC-type dipeptide/oligopeptide/nickel transport system permease component